MTVIENKLKLFDLLINYQLYDWIQLQIRCFFFNAKDSYFESDTNEISVYQKSKLYMGNSKFK